MNKAGIAPSVLEIVVLVSELTLMKTTTQTGDICFPMEISSVRARAWFRESTWQSRGWLTGVCLWELAGSLPRDERCGPGHEERGRANGTRGMGCGYVPTCLREVHAKVL